VVGEDMDVGETIIDDGAAMLIIGERIEKQLGMVRASPDVG
jgi:hypothetical protein